jgi:hypothetical protein
MTALLQEFGLMVGATVVAIAVVLGTAGIIGVIDRQRRRQAKRRKGQKLARMLDGRPLEDVLTASHYDYAHFQGEDGYRIFEKGTQNGFVDFAKTELDAHLWIVERVDGRVHKALPGPERDTRCP